MNKITYFCPVDWRWIKQRPQFLAEGLQQYGDVSVIYPWRNNRKGLQKKTSSSIKLCPYFTFPTLGGRLPLIEKINSVLSRIQIACRIRIQKPTVLWLTMPWQIDLISSKVKCPNIYDCMDDYIAINMRSDTKNDIQEQERKLIYRASLVFVSSQHLMNLIQARYQVEQSKLCLLRNGYHAEWPMVSKKVGAPDKYLRIGYFGTIGRWFDFETIMKSLSICSDIEYHLFGPTENGIQIPHHERIVVHGVVEHHQIPDCAKEMDALVMPFVPNEIVQSVDPVKLYEYICLNRPILCIHYPEVERFEPFVEFYDTQESYIEQIQQLRQRTEMKYTQQQAEAFLKKNHWAVRAEQAACKMDELMMEG